MKHKFIPDTEITEEHPAIINWKMLGNNNISPCAIDILKGASNNKSAIYRLVNITPDGRSLIAKRSREESIRVEKFIYGEVLPAIDIEHLHYFGSTIDKNGLGWIFLEEAVGIPYSESNNAHHKIASEWLSAFHTKSSRIDVHNKFPAIGPERYLGYLDKALLLIRENFLNPSLKPADLIVLNKIIARLETLNHDWDRITRFCATIPPCIVHGDFISKNIFINENQEPHISVFDWEACGWGVPAEDIGGLDLDVYWATEQISNLFGSRDQLNAVSDLGLVFRYIAWIYPTCIGLTSTWLEGTMQDLNTYEVKLSKSVSKIKGI